jgi:signal transduction histidine kinase
MLTYAALPSGSQVVVLRMATPVPELVEDMKERRGLLVAHAGVLVLLTVAGSLLAVPDRPPRLAPASDGAYTETFERLLRQGEALTHRHQEELRDLEAMARAGELTAGIAHEVRNGLGTILGYARLLAPVPGAGEVALGIQTECETLERVVRTFIDFVRREKLQAAPFDVGRMVRRVVAREQIRPGAAVEVLVTEALTLDADEELLERAFENLVRNAREAAGPEGHVEVAADRLDPTGARVVVSDTGPGFPSDVDVLRPFVSQRAGGLGLGLPIAVKIVRLHGGTVRLARREGGGARVEVKLPGATAEGPDVTIGDAARAAGPGLERSSSGSSD